MIVITAPTGNIGSQVLQNLLGSGEPIRVVARDPSKLPKDILNRVDVVEGSHSEAAVVAKACEGADSVFWLVPGDPRAANADAAYVDFGRPGSEAFRACGVKRVVGISALGRGWPRDAGHVSATLRLDDMIAETGVAYRALACSSLMENLLRQVDPIREQGMVFWPTDGDFKIPLCATRDVAAVAADLLRDPSWNGVDSIPLMGPEDISFNEMAAVMSDVLGKPIRFQRMTMEDMRVMMTRRGGSDGMAQAMVDMLTAKNEGMDHMIDRPSPSRCPTSFAAWCESVLKPAVFS